MIIAFVVLIVLVVLGILISEIVSGIKKKRKNKPFEYIEKNGFGSGFDGESAGG
jgi:hypothetical protein